MFCVLVLAWLFLPIYIAAGVSRWDVVSLKDLLGFKPPLWLMGFTTSYGTWASSGRQDVSHGAPGCSRGPGERGGELLPGNSTGGSGGGVRLLCCPCQSRVAPSPEEMGRGCPLAAHSEPGARHYSSQCLLSSCAGLSGLLRTQHHTEQ